MFGLGKNQNSIKVGQGFVKGNTIDYHKKHEVREKIIRYGKMLAASYGLGPKDKKKVKNEMMKLNKELRELEKKEIIANKRYQIAQKKKRIDELRGKTGDSTNLGKYFNEIPDMLGGVKSETKLSLPGSGKVPRYF